MGGTKFQDYNSVCPTAWVEIRKDFIFSLDEICHLLNDYGGNMRDLTTLSIKSCRVLNDFGGNIRDLTLLSRDVYCVFNAALAGCVGFSHQSLS